MLRHESPLATCHVKPNKSRKRIWDTYRVSLVLPPNQRWDFLVDWQWHRFGVQNKLWQRFFLFMTVVEGYLELGHLLMGLPSHPCTLCTAAVGKACFRLNTRSGLFSISSIARSSESKPWKGSGDNRPWARSNLLLDAKNPDNHVHRTSGCIPKDARNVQQYQHVCHRKESEGCEAHTLCCHWVCTSRTSETRVW